MKTAVITGYGLITPFGEDAATVFRHPNREDAAPLIDRVSDERLKLRLPGRNLRALDRTSQLLAAAAGLALDSTNLSSAPGLNIGLVNGTMFSSGKTISAFDCRALREGPAFASALDFANTVINASSGQTAICFGLCGENTTISTGLSSGLKAVTTAADTIRSGRSTALLAGGVEELSDELRAAFEESGMLASRFSPAANRSALAPGLQLCEAAALLVLEEKTSAVARGARALATVAGVGSAFNSSMLDDRESLVESIVRSMHMALADASLSADNVDCIVASQNGIAFPDECEGLAIEQIFRAIGLPEVFAPKKVFGECLGAGGPMQVISGLLRMSASVEKPFHRILVNSVSYDGHCCSVLLTSGTCETTHRN